MDETQHLADNPNKEVDQARWRRRLLAVIWLAVFPPLGVIFLWCSERYSQSSKRWGTAVGTLWLFMLAGGGSQGMHWIVIWAPLCIVCILAWRRWGTRLDALLRRHDEHYAELNGLKVKRQAHLVVVAVLLVAFAPLAIVAAALSKQFSAREKIAVAVAGLFWMVALVGIIAGAGRSAHDVSRVAENSVIPGATPAPADPESEARAIIEKIAKQSFGGPSTVDVYQRPEGAVGAGLYSIEAHCKTITATKGFIVPQIRRFYINLYTSPIGPKIWDAWVFVNADLVDRFGNESEDLVYKTAMERDVVDKINWKNAEMVDLPHLWKESYISRSLGE